MTLLRARRSNQGEDVPAPLTDRKDRSVFKVRVTAVLHRDQVIEGAEAGASHSRLVSARLDHG